MGTQGALVHTTQGGIRYMAYYAQGGPIPLFHRAEAINSCGFLGLDFAAQNRRPVGAIMIIVETQLHSGNLESSQRNLEECAPYPK